MRKCCCCISVHIGSAILGFIGLIICSLELVVLLPFILRSCEVIDSNPFEDYYIDNPYWRTIFEEETLKEVMKLSPENATMVMAYVDMYKLSVSIGFSVEAGIYWLCCLLMMIGVLCRIRWAMLPYLVVQMLCILAMVLSMVGITVVLFMNSNHEFGNSDLNYWVVGIVFSVVTLVITALLFYFWAAVQRAYMELGNNDYMYSPAPIKPVGVGHYDGRGHADHYPTSPQHFAMDERH